MVEELDRVDRVLEEGAGSFAGTDEAAEFEGDRGLLPLVFDASDGGAAFATIILPFTILIPEEEVDGALVGGRVFETFSGAFASLVMLGNELVL